jgi:allantoinase
MFALRSENIVCDETSRPGMVLIDKGRIIDITDQWIADSIPVIDLGRKYLLPGMVDPHVHINEPGRTEWEGFDSATKAAIAGGVTSLMEMPLNSIPVTTSLRSYQLKLATASQRIHCHCGFWGGIVPGNEHEIEGMIREGVRGFKAFLVDSGIDEFPASTEEDLRKIMPILSSNGIPLLVHCEMKSGSRQSGGDPRSYQRYLASRPRTWEDRAIELMIRLCREFQCPVHIVHLSSSNSLAQIHQAKDEGLPLTVETAPHYLYFSSEEIPDGNTAFKCAPPIREKENNDKLFDALRGSVIDFVATDHSPVPPSMKQIETGDLDKAWGGIASLQFSLSILWTIMRRKGEPIGKLGTWLSKNSAKLPAFEKKGQLKKGADADILVFDAEKKFTVKEDIILHKHKITPYLGEELFGVVEQVYLSGEKLFEKGKFLHLNRGKIL